METHGSIEVSYRTLAIDAGRFGQILDRQYVCLDVILEGATVEVGAHAVRLKLQGFVAVENGLAELATQTVVSSPAKISLERKKGKYFISLFFLYPIYTCSA